MIDERRGQRHRAATLDHILWGGANLDTALDTLEELTGVRATYGGQHPDLGTHNAVAALGPKTFIEVIAPDPKLKAGALAHRLQKLPAPTLLMWAATTPSATQTAAHATAEGYEATVAEGHRPRPDGAVVRWTNVFVSGHGAGILVPFFIQWATASHPASEAPSDLRLKAFHAETPQPAALKAVLEALDVKLAVRKGNVARLVAVLDTPRGLVTLTST